MFSIVTHNAVGTVHSFIRGFGTVETAEAYRQRWGHAGVGHDSPIIATQNEDCIRAINDRHSPEAQKLYLMSDAQRQYFDDLVYDFLYTTCAQQPESYDEALAALTPEAREKVQKARQRAEARAKAEREG